MEEEVFNKRIAMAMLRQCALVWEYCVSCHQPYLDAKFRLADVKCGAYGKKTKRQKSKIGMIDVDVEHPKWEGTFRLKVGQIEGVTLNYDNSVKLTVDDFSCSYMLEHVFEIAYGFCSSVGCLSLVNKMVFGFEGGERYAILPDCNPAKKSAKKKADVRCKKADVKHQTSSVSHQTSNELTLAERLRQALLARLAA